MEPTPPQDKPQKLDPPKSYTRDIDGVEHYITMAIRPMVFENGQIVAIEQAHINCYTGEMRWVPLSPVVVRPDKPKTNGASIYGLNGQRLKS